MNGLEGSDEEYCDDITCGGNTVECTSEPGTCIHSSWLCDGDMDCYGGSDEQNCAKTTVATAEGTPGVKKLYTVTEAEVTLEQSVRTSLAPKLSKTAVPTSLDTVGPERLTSTTFKRVSDLQKTCSHHEFECTSGPYRCILFDWLCDGYKDCTDGSDERDCPGVTHWRVSTKPQESTHFQVSTKPQESTHFQVLTQSQESTPPDSTKPQESTHSQVLTQSQESTHFQVLTQSQESTPPDSTKPQESTHFQVSTKSQESTHFQVLSQSQESTPPDSTKPQESTHFQVSTKPQESTHSQVLTQSQESTHFQVLTQSQESTPPDSTKPQESTHFQVSTKPHESTPSLVSTRSQASPQPSASTHYPLPTYSQKWTPPPTPTVPPVPTISPVQVSTPEYTRPEVSTIPTRPTLTHKSTIPPLPSLPPVPTIPSIPTLPPVPTIPSIPTLPPVPTIHPKSTFPPISTIPPIPTLPPISTKRPKPTRRPFPTIPPIPTLPPIPTIPPIPTLPPISTIRPKPTRRPFPTIPPIPTLPPISTIRPKPTRRPFPTIPPIPTLPPIPTVPPKSTLPPVPTIPPVPTVSPGRTCPPNHYQCLLFPGICVPPDFRCDGETDCPQGDDEDGCSGRCPPPLYTCQDSDDCYNSLWICDGENDCPLGDDEQDCKGPKATYTCSQTPTSDGYVKGKTLDCTCKLETPPGHSGIIEWEVVNGPTPAKIKRENITMEYRRLYEELHYACRGYLVRKYPGNYTDIKAKFAFFDENSVVLMPSVLTFCDPNHDASTTGPSDLTTATTTTTTTSSGTTSTASSLKTATPDSSIRRKGGKFITCKVSKLSVNPAPLFSFSVNGGGFDTPTVGHDTGTHYIRRLWFESKDAGQNFVKCLVTNPIFSDLEQEVHKPVWIRATPPGPPVLKIFGRNFRGVRQPNVTLALSNLRHVDLKGATCVVKGGYPAVTVTHKGCATHWKQSSRELYDKDVEHIDRIYCFCTADHVSGCYSNNTTEVTFIVEAQTPETTVASTEIPTTTTATTTTTPTTTTATTTRTRMTTIRERPKATTSVNLGDGASKGDSDSNNNSHTKLLYVFIVISIIAVIIIVILVIVVVAVIHRKNKNYHVGGNQKYMFSEMSSSNASY